jgi:site-specific DNA-cytosine methylase
MTLIQRIDIPQIVEVRKYEVNTKSLCELLCVRKKILGFSCKYIAESLGVPKTKAEHWFRKDNCFAIPEPTVWMELKNLLQIDTDEFDNSIMTFEKKEGVYEKSERHYFADGIAPTLTSTSAGKEKFIVAERKKVATMNSAVSDCLRIRRLTPKECFRLMGFDDSDFEKAEVENSNAQLYKQAGNSIAVPVVEHIIGALFDCGAL